MGSTMTDHELCMAAAKAAGYTVELDDQLNKTLGDRFKVYIYRITDIERGDCVAWSPIEDDCDAFRLMVDCGLAVANAGAAVVYGEDGAMEWFFVPDCTDKHAATRRAIVRAAAAMGEDK